MNVFNSKMLLLVTNQIVGKKKLHAKLDATFSGGFIQKNDCYFLKKLLQKQRHINSSDFVDKTGYECFINSLHIDDYIEQDYFVNAMLFVEKLIIEWNKFNNLFSLKIILSQTDFGFNIKFHLLRPNESWINETEIEKFNEGILMFTSSTDIVSDSKSSL